MFMTGCSPKITPFIEEPTKMIDKGTFLEIDKIFPKREKRVALRKFDKFQTQNPQIDRYIRTLNYKTYILLYNGDDLTNSEKRNKK